MTSLYGIVKGMGPLVKIVVMPYLWDGWPVWISKMIPLWYVIFPIVEIVNEGKVFSDVALDLGIAGMLSIALLFAALTIAKRRARYLDGLG